MFVQCFIPLRLEQEKNLGLNEFKLTFWQKKKPELV